MSETKLCSLIFLQKCMKNKKNHLPNMLQIQIKANNGFKRIFRFIISLKTDQIGFVISNFSFNISKSSISSDGTDKCVATIGWKGQNKLFGVIFDPVLAVFTRNWSYFFKAYVSILTYRSTMRKYNISGNGNNRMSVSF